MGEIVDFPGFDERNWQEIEAGLRVVMAAGGADAAMMDWISADLKPRYASCQAATIRIDIPNVPPRCLPAVLSAFQAVGKFHRGIQMQMLIELVCLELELYTARHGGEPTLGAGFAEKVRLSDRLFGVIEGGKGDEPAPE